VATSALSKVTLAERPDLTDPLRESGLDGDLSWPRFYEGNAVNALYGDRVYREFADYQVLFLDADETIVAAGHTLPLYWDGTIRGLPEGRDHAIERAFTAERKPNTLMAVAAVAHPSVKKTGLGTHIVEAMGEVGRRNGLHRMIAALRPTRKESYPLASFEEYINWTHPDGSAFDPWLRANLNLGGRMLKVAPESLVVEASLEQWMEWTGGRFPATGAYVVPGALAPMHIDVEKNTGRYAEPNVWVELSLADLGR
jgi:GNAT superfamily N-acetyltransferase